MVSGSPHFEEYALVLPITQIQRHMANRFALEQPTPVKADQMRRRTLAVMVVQNYLDMLGFSTQLGQSGLWNPVLRLVTEAADLPIFGIGRLECCPVLPQPTTYICPPDAWEDRAGYVAVEIPEDLSSARLLGFVPQLEHGVILPQRIQSPEALLDHLHHLMPVTALSDALTQASTQLGRWFTGLVDAGWQQLDTLLAEQSLEPSMAFRGVTLATPPQTEPRESIRRAKLLDLGPAVQQPMALVVALDRQPDSTAFDITLQVHPLRTAVLPPDLALTVLESEGSEFMAAESRQSDNYIQLCFSGQPGETFSARIALGRDEIVESFMI